MIFLVSLGSPGNLFRLVNIWLSFVSTKTSASLCFSIATFLFFLFFVPATVFALICPSDANGNLYNFWIRFAFLGVATHYPINVILLSELCQLWAFWITIKFYGLEINHFFFVPWSDFLTNIFFTFIFFLFLLL